MLTWISCVSLFFYHTPEFLLLPNRALVMLIWSVIFFLYVLINHFKSLFSKFISIFKINFEICHWFEHHTLYKQIVIKSKKLDSSIADALLYFKGLFLNIHWRQIINPWAINVSKIWMWGEDSKQDASKIISRGRTLTFVLFCSVSI